MERAPAVAGTFYEADASALLGQVDGFLGAAGGNKTPQAVSAVMAPHAGYAFCGAVLGQVYARAVVPNRVLILAPNHTGLGQAAAVSPAGFCTPLGTVPLDVPLAGALVARGPLAWDELAHAEEHAVEVHLPFLLRRNPAVRMTAVCLRTMSFAMCEEIGRIVADVVAAADSPVLVVASSDMNHHEPQRVASRKDRMALERIVEMDARGLYSGVVEHNVSMCGVVPTVVALVAARALGARHASVVAYANSGDVDGDYSSVVGYAGVLMLQKRPRVFLRSFEDEETGVLGGCGTTQAGHGGRSILD